MNIQNDFAEILNCDTSHKYLGKKLPGQISKRGRTALDHRIKLAWCNFNKYRDISNDKNIAIQSKLRLFQSCISPTVLFGLTSSPLTSLQMQELDVVQRRMLRIIVGWHRIADEDWESTMSRMKAKIITALMYFPLESWSQQLMRHQFKLGLHCMNNVHDWPSMIIRWHPEHTCNTAYRTRGRPCKRWDDNLSQFSHEKFHDPKWMEHIRSNDIEDYVARFSYPIINE